MSPQFRPCDRCDNPATVHLTEIRGGKKTEKHLCESCARQLHLPQAGPPEIQKLLETVEPLTRAARAAAHSCPECGMTYAEFRQHGRFGCANDYEAFREELDRLFQRIHGANRYAGLTPKGRVVDGGRVLEELQLARRALQEAVAAENYEEAARLRDRIRHMAEDGGEPGAAKG